MMCDHGPGPSGAILLPIIAALSIAAIIGIGWFFTAFQEAREFDRMEQHR